MRQLIFDLDGTLIDATQRLYLLFQHLAAKSTLKYEEYWALKRNKVGHTEILKSHFNYTQKEIDLFQQKWMELIEQADWLKHDKPFAGVDALLKKLKSKNRLHLATARQSKLQLNKQLDSFGWTNIFEKIFVTEQKIDKYNLLKQSIVLSQTDWMIGDTGKDIEAGKKLGVRTAAVLSGFLNEEQLKQYQPNILVKSVLDVPFNNN